MLGWLYGQRLWSGRFTLGAILLSLGALTNRASADNLTFVNTLHGGNSGTAWLYYQPSGSSLLAEPCYSDILVWSDQSSSTSLPSTIYTYCVDIVGNIYSGLPYTLSNDGAMTASNANNNGITQLESPSVIAAIDNLFANVPGGLPLPGGSANSTSATIVSDAQFQAALWAIIYDNSYLGLSTATATAFGQLPTSTLPFTMSNYYSIASGDPLTPAELATAFGWAQGAWKNTLTPMAGAGLSGGTLDLLAVTDPGDETANNEGQSQIYLGYTPASATTPLPASLAGGLVLLGLVGMLRWPGRT